MQKPWSKIRLPVQISISLMSMAWVVHVLIKIDWGASAQAMQRLSLMLMIACFFSAGLIYVTRLFRLRCWIERLSNTKLSAKEWISLYLKSIAFGSITPARLGDFSRIALVGRTGLNFADRTRVVFHDKMADVLYVPIGICLTSGIVGEKLNIPGVWIFAGGMLSLVVYMSLSYLFLKFLGIKAVLFGFAVTIAGLGLFILSNAFLFRSVGINLTMLDIAAITLSAGIIASLPVSAGGLGVRECSLIYLLGLWGIQPESIPPVLILEFILNMVFPVILYICWTLCINIKKMLT
jgi:glycosyltransferase 2 family protein